MIPTFLVNVKKILLMIPDKNRGVTFSYLINNCWMFWDNSLKLRVIFSCNSNTFCQTKRYVKNIVFKSKQSRLGDCWIFCKIFMYVLRIYEPFEINFQHHCHITNKEVFHVKILRTFMFFPNKISDESLYDKPFFAYFI